MNFAIVENGIVTNIIWLYPTTVFPNSVPCGECSVQVGDTYEDGKFYHNNKVITSAYDDMQNALNILGVQS